MRARTEENDESPSIYTVHTIYIISVVTGFIPVDPTFAEWQFVPGRIAISRWLWRLQRQWRGRMYTLFSFSTRLIEQEDVRVYAEMTSCAAVCLCVLSCRPHSDDVNDTSECCAYKLYELYRYVRWKIARHSVRDALLNLTPRFSRRRHSSSGHFNGISRADPVHTA